MSLVCYYYSNCNTSRNNINMPKKEKIHQSIERPIEIKRTPSYELNNKSECFDPNISSSPSNVFMTNLKNRMDTYYSDMCLTSMCRRERANSMEMFLRKHT